MFNLILVVLGIIIFGCSIYLHIRFLKLVRKTSFKKWGVALLIMLLFFTLGYIIFAYWLATDTEFINIIFFETLVSFIFFFGSIFVLTTISFIYSLVKNLKNEGVELEKKVKERTAELERFKNNQEKIIVQKTDELNKTITGLRESEKRFRQVAENAEEWIWEIDKEGLYIYANPALEKVLGYKPEEIVGKKHFYDFFTSDTREDLKKVAFEVFVKKEAFKNFLNPNVHKNGNVVLLETSGSPILNERGDLFGYRGLDTDVTTRKKTEKDLKSHVEELERINKLTINRELKIIELKKEIEELKNKLSKV